MISEILESPRRLATPGHFRRRTADGPRTRDRITMSDRPSQNLDGLDIDLVRRIDEVCRRFEADWRGGAPTAHRGKTDIQTRKTERGA
jgi:hypothetical protein